MTTENTEGPRLSAAETRMLGEIRGGLDAIPSSLKAKVCETLLAKGQIVVTREGKEVASGVQVGDKIELAEAEPATTEEAAPPADKPPEEEPKEPTRRTRMLPVKLADSELIGIGDSINALLVEAEELEDEKKSSASEFKSRLDKIAEQVRKLSNQHRSRHVDREVEVTVRQDLTRACEETYRLDTGALVETRTLASYELEKLRQLSIDVVNTEEVPE